ncbi:asparaginase [Salinicoccus halodurans]|uniref:Asparaginase n=1 Tax=Salinicoccus halodurans TaxID=407035 RepID=A0A0F7HLF6_9STAP|nr:asparaginase [Salinicoccus halodurans]AKG74068.1 asparaginase [Salinicoccus halodurans]SFK59982.1 asparaginase [Salinicoccus halodurans]
MNNKILAIHTGGTISMSSEDGLISSGEDNPVTLDSTVELDIRLEEIYPVKKPSPHMTLDDMLAIRDIILERKTDFDGFVITHGTDTLEETAYFLDLALDISAPVIVTGAMRSFNEIGSDGLYNYISSLRTARDPASADRGVLVVFNDEIHTARNVTKTHTSNIATFQSPNHGPIGFLTKDSILYHHQIAHQDQFDDVDLEFKVGLIKAHADLDDTFFDALIEAGYHGLVLEALGQGNIPPSALGGLQKVLDHGIDTVLVSRSFNGIVGSYYDYVGGGHDLANRGVIFSNGLNGQKARIKLLLALSNGLKGAALEEIFRH